MNLVEKLAQEEAVKDWGTKSVFTHTIATFGEGPTLDHLHGFYCRYFSRYHDKRDREYCDSYNSKVLVLLKDKGLPSWAPLSRLPDRTEVLKLVGLYGKSFDEFDGSLKEKRKIESIYTMGQYIPKVFTRNEERQILLIAGDKNKGASKIDIIDLECFRWMDSYEYLRKHVGNFPWD